MREWYRVTTILVVFGVLSLIPLSCCLEEKMSSTDDPCYCVMPEIPPDQCAFRHIPEHGFSLFLASRTKTIHFVRHAEGFHNQAIREYGDETPTIWSTPGSEQYEDARLNEIGIEQCKSVRRTSIEGKLRPELVVVSPLSRTIETAHYLFHNMTPRTPFIVHDICRERMGLYTNDRRRSKSIIRQELEPMYGLSGDSIDFDTYGFKSEEDVDWKTERESDESCSARGIQLLHWLSKRPEQEIAVVTHSSFLRHLLSGFGDQLSDADRTTLQRKTGNAEIRSVTLAAHRKT